MATLTIDHVTKTYRQKGHPDTLAVKDISMEIADGEIIGLVGSSGCGKTTTLRMVAGFESITEGAITIGKTRVNDLKPADRNVAMAFEGYALYPPLCVRDNIAFSLLRNRMPRKAVMEKVQSIAELLEITDLLELFPPVLSGGQQQRVSLARALIRTADTFLLDEPMSQLEPHLRAKLRARIKDYLIGNKMTSIFVTHDQTEAMALADRIAVMDDGVLQQLGSPMDLKERPANLFVASFIGEPPMNLLQGTLALGGGAGRVQLLREDGQPAFQVALPLAGLKGLTDGQRVHLGIRPHKTAVGPVSGAQQVPARVVSSQWLGDQSNLGLDVGGCFVVVVADRRLQAAVDSVVQLSLPNECLHLFDSATGKALLHGPDLPGGVVTEEARARA